jgi:hypothetical protein
MESILAFLDLWRQNENYLLPDKSGLSPVGCDDSDVVGGEMQAAVVMLHQFTHHQSLLAVAEQQQQGGCRQRW